jgi:hypothetical protein
MGQRKHQRVKMVLPIRVAGHDAGGQAFSVLAHTLDFSRTGARLGGIQAQLQVGDEVTIEYKRRRGRFVVRWVDGKRPVVGAENLDPERFTFIELPEGSYLDDADASSIRQQAASVGVPSTVSSGMGAPLARDEIARNAVASARSKEAPVAAGQPALAGKIAELKHKLQQTKDDTDTALQVVADATREMLPARGAAIAVASGEEWICRASSGVAPRIGVQFRLPGGLTGEAARSGKIVICGDTQTDPRVNTAVWRSVQLRSCASVPIGGKDNVIGVLEVFAEDPNAFGDEHGPVLSELGDLLVQVIGAHAKR